MSQGDPVSPSIQYLCLYKLTFLYLRPITGAFPFCSRTHTIEARAHFVFTSQLNVDVHVDTITV